MLHCCPGFQKYIQFGMEEIYQLQKLNSEVAKLPKCQYAELGPSFFIENSSNKNDLN